MRKGTFSAQKAKQNSDEHNSRKSSPKYLIDSSANNYYELITPDNEFKKIAQNIYKEKIKQTMQKKQVDNLIQETVLTLRPEQNENDVKDLFVKLNKKFGGHELLEVAIHRDEGYFLRDDIAYYPTKNILKKDDNNWYICSNTSIAKPKKDDFDKIVNIDEFEKVYNIHAHAKFSMFDRATGKSARMQKKDMSERIKFVSNELGLLFAPDKATSHIKKSVNLVKDEHLARARANEDKKKLKEELAELKKANNQFRAEMKDYDLLREDYKKQEDLNKQLQADLKASKIDLSTALEEIEKLKQDIFHPVKTYKKDNSPAKYKDVANYYERENKSLQEQLEKEKAEKENLEKTFKEREAEHIEELDHYGYREKLQENKSLRKEVADLNKALFVKEEALLEKNEEIDYYKSRLETLEKAIDLINQKNTIKEEKRENQYNHQDFNLNRF